MMAAKAVLVRPHTALCLVHIRPRTTSLPFLRRIMASYDLSRSGRSLFTGKLPRHCFACPIQRRAFNIRATMDSDSSASIGSPLMESMEKKIKERLPAESVIVKDASGDGRHVSIEVVSSAFQGESAMNRQRMVYKAIWEELQDRVHAVDHMTTLTPAEVKR